MGSSTHHTHNAINFPLNQLISKYVAAKCPGLRRLESLLSLKAYVVLCTQQIDWILSATCSPDESIPINDGHDIGLDVVCCPSFDTLIYWEGL